MSNLSIEYNGLKHSVQSEECSKPWGKGVKLSILNPDGDLLNTISYSCHPDFLDFELFQSKSITELSRIALSRVASDTRTSDFKGATENGIHLLLPFNNVPKT